MKVDYPAHWAECRFEQVLNYIQPGPYIVESTDYDDSYKIPVLTAGKSFIKGYTNETAGVFSELPVIIFDDFTTATQYVNFPFKVKSSAMKILVPTSSDLNLKFLFYLMQVTHVNTDSHKRYWIGIYSKEKVCLPPINEQHRILAKIEELFSELDKGVESLKKAREQLKVYRQALLKHAFEGKLTEHLPSRQAGWRDPEFRNISDKHVPIDSSHFFAYVLVCEGERLYKGFTSNLFERINQHLLGHGSKFTKDNKPLSLLHFEEFETEREALDREKYFKSGSGREWLYELKAQQEEKHPTADQLLERIKQERETRYQQQLEEWKAAVKQWEADRTVGKKPAKPKQINQIELLEQSELPELPFGWLWFSVSQLCEVVRGGSPRPAGDPKYYDGDIPFLKVADITRNPGVYLDTFTYTIKDAGLKKTRLVEPPVLMLSNSGATLGVPKICQIKATFNDGIAAFLGLPETAQLFHYYFWESKTMELRNINQGAAQPNLNTNLIQEYILPVCSELEMVEVSKIIEQNMSICSKIEDDISKQLRLAEALRQSILKKAFSGQLVSQDPNDEPASVLLDRIAEEKAEAEAMAEKTRASKKSERIMQRRERIP